MVADDRVEEIRAPLRDMDRDVIAARIKGARLKAQVEGKTVKLSHDEIIERMGESSRQHLIKLEAGTHRIGPRLLLLYAEATGYSVDWFLASGPSPFPRRFR